MIIQCGSEVWKVDTDTGEGGREKSVLYITYIRTNLRYRFFMLLNQWIPVLSVKKGEYWEIPPYPFFCPAFSSPVLCENCSLSFIKSSVLSSSLSPPSTPSTMLSACHCCLLMIVSASKLGELPELTGRFQQHAAPHPQA